MASSQHAHSGTPDRHSRCWGVVQALMALTLGALAAAAMLSQHQWGLGPGAASSLRAQVVVKSAAAAAAQDGATSPVHANAAADNGGVSDSSMVGGSGHGAAASVGGSSDGSAASGSGSSDGSGSGSNDGSESGSSNDGSGSGSSDGSGSGSSGAGEVPHVPPCAPSANPDGPLPLCTSNPEPGTWQCHIRPAEAEQEASTCLLRPPVWTPTGCALEPPSDLAAASKTDVVCRTFTQQWGSLTFVGDSIVREMHEQMRQMMETAKPPSTCWPLNGDGLRKPSGAPLCGGTPVNISYYRVENKWDEAHPFKAAVLDWYDARMRTPGDHVLLVGLGIWWLKQRPYSHQPSPNPPFWEVLHDVGIMGLEERWRLVPNVHPDATMTVVFMPMHYRNAKNPQMPKYWKAQNNDAVLDMTQWGLNQLHELCPIRNGWDGHIGLPRPECSTPASASGDSSSDGPASRRRRRLGSPGVATATEAGGLKQSLEYQGGLRGVGGLYLLDVWRMSKAVVDQCPMGQPPNAPGGTHLGAPGSRVKAQLLLNLLSEVRAGVEASRK